jgi:propionyl-CoA carboxylase alpha chain
MIRVAAGQPLRFAQDDVKLNGWAIESRLYAEDPYRNFLPSIGRLTRYRPPVEGRRPDGTIVRNDTGVYEGGEISMHYDPMIAKLCTWAPDRAGAVAAMSDALDRFEIEGVGNNLPFLSAVMNHPRFREGRLTTAFIAEEYPDGFTGVEPSENDVRRLAAVAALVNLIAVERDAQVSGALANHTASIGRDWVVAIGDREIACEVARSDGNEAVVTADDGSPIVVATSWRPGRTLGEFTVDSRDLAIKVSRNGSGSGWRLRWRGVDVRVHVRRPRIAELARLLPKKPPPDTTKILLCPMPGVVTAIHVGNGDAVEQGQPLVVVEAMKMENTLRAERAAIVKNVAVAVGARLAVDELIMEFE